MRIKQLSVFVENQQGRLAAILEVLQKIHVNLQALLVSETAEFCIVRMVVDKPEEGLEALRRASFTTRTDWLLRVEVPDVPGGLLNSVIIPLTKVGIYPQYFYGYTAPPTNKAMILLKTADIEKTEKVLAVA